MNGIHTDKRIDDEFADRVAALFEEAERARGERTSALSRTMAERDRVEAEFQRIAADVQREVLRPRIETVAQRFAGVHVEHFTSPGGVSTRCTFPHTPRFPASTTLDLGIMLDVDANVASLTRRTEIVPALFTYERFAHRDVPLAQLGAATAAPWVEEQLIEFVALYLRLEVDANYQQSPRHRDPVCGMELTGADAAAAFTFEHHTYLFCSSNCETKFRADPALYIKHESRATSE